MYSVYQGELLGAAVGVLQAEEVVPLVGHQISELEVVVAAEQPDRLEVGSEEVDVFRAVEVVVPREGIPVVQVLVVAIV